MASAEYELKRIADALERIADRPQPEPDVETRLRTPGYYERRFGGWADQFRDMDESISKMQRNMSSVKARLLR